MFVVLTDRSVELTKVSAANSRRNERFQQCRRDITSRSPANFAKPSRPNRIAIIVVPPLSITTRPLFKM